MNVLRIGSVVGCSAATTPLPPVTGGTALRPFAFIVLLAGGLAWICEIQAAAIREQARGDERRCIVGEPARPRTLASDR